MSKCYICEKKTRKGDSITLNDHIIDSSTFDLCIEHQAEVSRWLAKSQKNLGKTGTDYSKCPFCKIGQYNRMLMWRLVKDLSRSELKRKLEEKKAGKIKFKIKL